MLHAWVMLSQAYVQLAKMEREQAEREQQAKDEERRRKMEEKKRKKRMLEAAFDGDLNEIKNVLKEVSAVVQQEYQMEANLKINHVFNFDGYFIYFRSIVYIIIQ